MCAAANYSGPNVTNGFATLRRFRQRISSSILTIPEYLSEFQLFQMKNVSIKTKNGLKSAQKNVKGRPALPKKTVITESARRSMTRVYDSINRIMASDRPPQTPSKDYRHFTPEVDDDGWGSDFDSEGDHSDIEDEDQEEEFDDEYEEPQPKQPPMSRFPGAPISKGRRDPPVPIPGTVGNSHARKCLPPEPPTQQEVCEDPHEESSDDKEDYEEPQPPKSVKPLPRFPPTPSHAHSHPGPRRLTPPSLPQPTPPRLPPRGAGKQEIPTEEVYEIEDGTDGQEEDYEKPDGMVGGAEIISTPGKLKPSDIARPKVGKSSSKPSPPWQDQGRQPGPPIALQLNEKISKGVTHAQRENQGVKPPIGKHPPFTKPPASSKPPTNGMKGSSLGLARRTLPRPPEDQEIEGLYSYIWYHGDLTRDSATEKLSARSKNGMFLVRKSSKTGSPYALSLYYGTRVYNLNIRLCPDNKYALGTKKADENTYVDVPSLIRHFQTNCLVLGGDPSNQTTLALALPK